MRFGCFGGFSGSRLFLVHILCRDTPGTQNPHRSAISGRLAPLVTFIHQFPWDGPTLKNINRNSAPESKPAGRTWVCFLQIGCLRPTPILLALPDSTTRYSLWSAVQGRQPSLTGLKGKVPGLSFSLQPDKQGCNQIES